MVGLCHFLDTFGAHYKQKSSGIEVFTIASYQTFKKPVPVSPSTQE